MPPLTVLTGVAVETLGAAAAPCEPVTGAIVLAQAVQGAASPILSWEALCWQDMDRKTDKQTITALTQKNLHCQEMIPRKLFADQ